MFLAKNQRAFVTGSEGFIGSHLCELLVESGYQVRGLVLYNSFGSKGWLDDLPPAIAKNIEVVFGDIRDLGQMRELTKDVDVVFHLAALIGIPYSYHAPMSYTQTNVVGTQNLLEAVRGSERINSFIHTSTSEVYGSAQIVPMAETHPLNAQSPYAASKIGADMMALSYGRSFEMPVRVLRPFNTFGPRQSARAIIPNILSQMIAGKTTLKVGSVTPTRDLNYVRNTAEAFLAVASSDACNGEVVNAGMGSEISVKDLISLCSEVTGRKVTVETEAERVRPDKSEVTRLHADASKIKKLTGWTPKVDLKTGLQHTVKWLEKNIGKYDVERYNV